MPVSVVVAVFSFVSSTGHQISHNMYLYYVYRFHNFWRIAVCKDTWFAFVWAKCTKSWWIKLAIYLDMRRLEAIGSLLSHRDYPGQHLNWRRSPRGLYLSGTLHHNIGLQRVHSQQSYADFSALQCMQMAATVDSWLSSRISERTSNEDGGWVICP